MTATVFDGKQLLGKLSSRIKRAAERIRKQRHIEVGLGILLVTGDTVSMSDATKIAGIAEELGIIVHIERVAQRNVGRKFYPTLEEYADSPFIQGIYVQLPLPTQIVPLSEVMKRLPPEKDVAGLHFINRGMATFPPHEVKFTVQPPENLAVAATLRECSVPLKGGKILLVSSNMTTGAIKLLAGYLFDLGADIRIIHSASLRGHEKVVESRLHTNAGIHLPEVEQIINPDGEAIITWTNHAGWLTRSRVKRGSVIIDMGYKFARGRISGDCDFSSLSGTASILTPVPGGIRNIVHIMILQNLIFLIEKRIDEVEADVSGRLERRFGGKKKNLK